MRIKISRDEYSPNYWIKMYDDFPDLIQVPFASAFLSREEIAELHKMLGEFLKEVTTL